MMTSPQLDIDAVERLSEALEKALGIALLMQPANFTNPALQGAAWALVDLLFQADDARKQLFEHEEVPA
jgi:hypothetical protein